MAPYVKQTWIDGSAGGTEIDAASLTHIEDGIEEADTVARAAQSTADTANATATTAAADAASALATANTANGNAVGALQESIANAKGDLLVATADDAVGILPAAADGRLLETDTSTTEGIKWGRKFTTGYAAPLSPQVGDIWLDLNI